MKWLADECVFLHQFREFTKYAATLDPAIECVHLNDLYGKGAKDEDWLKHAAADGWIVIISDRGRAGGSRLPELAPLNKVTTLFMNRKLHHSPSETKVRALYWLVEQREVLHEIKPGTRLRLRLSEAGFTLEVWPTR